MAIRYRIDILDELKKAGYSTYRIRNEKIFGQAIIQQFRNNEPTTWITLDKLCRLLHCQPGDILEYYEDDPEVPSVV